MYSLLAEVTCDYALFDYHCNGHEIELCACGSPNCRGKMTGFSGKTLVSTCSGCCFIVVIQQFLIVVQHIIPSNSGLSLCEKVNILSYVEQEIKDKFIKDDNVVIFTSTLPTGIGLVCNGDEQHLVATKRFDAGETIFTNHCTIVSKSDLSSKTFVVEIDGKYILLDKEHHFIHRDEYAEFLGFDSFMDHSCNPSTEQRYTSEEEYTLKAKRTILPGEKVTCDYTKLDGALGMKNAGTSSFQCKCGEINCYGMLVC